MWVGGRGVWLTVWSVGLASAAALAPSHAAGDACTPDYIAPTLPVASASRLPSFSISLAASSTPLHSGGGGRVERGATGGVREGCRQKVVCRPGRRALAGKLLMQHAPSKKHSCECARARSKLNQEESGLPATHLRERKTVVRLSMMVTPQPAGAAWPSCIQATRPGRDGGQAGMPVRQAHGQAGGRDKCTDALGV
jgi:hypothetical protein